jgi:TfoX/Sxy family transcriptional regulator of competence genes
MQAVSTDAFRVQCPMPTSKNFIAYLEDCFSSIRGVRFKAMFGEYALYLNDVVVGLVCDQTVFLKRTDETSLLLKDRVKTGPPYPGAKPAYMLTESELEDDELIARVLSAAYRDLSRNLRPKKAVVKKKKKSR